MGPWVRTYVQQESEPFLPSQPPEAHRRTRASPEEPGLRYVLRAGPPRGRWAAARRLM